MIHLEIKSKTPDNRSLLSLRRSGAGFFGKHEGGDDADRDEELF